MRRPLGVGTGSLAILSALSEEEVKHVVASNTPRLPEYGLTPTSLVAQVKRAQKLGYAYARCPVSRACVRSVTRAQPERRPVRGASHIRDLQPHERETRRRACDAAPERGATRRETAFRNGRSEVEHAWDNQPVPVSGGCEAAGALSPGEGPHCGDPTAEARISTRSGPRASARFRVAPTAMRQALLRRPRAPANESCKHPLALTSSNTRAAGETDIDPAVLSLPRRRAWP